MYFTKCGTSWSNGFWGSCFKSRALSSHIKLRQYKLPSTTCKLSLKVRFANVLISSGHRRKGKFCSAWFNAVVTILADTRLIFLCWSHSDCKEFSIIEFCTCIGRFVNLLRVSLFNRFPACQRTIIPTWSSVHLLSMKDRYMENSKFCSNTFSCSKTCLWTLLSGERVCCSSVSMPFRSDSEGCQFAAEGCCCCPVVNDAMFVLLRKSPLVSPR